MLPLFIDTALLGEICKIPKTLSRNRFVSLYKTDRTKNSSLDMDFLANEDFNEFAGCGCEYIDSTLVHQDFIELKRKVNTIEDYADKRLAHFDKSPPDVIPTFEELDECIDFLEHLMQKYYLLFRGEGLLAILPVYPSAWKDIFREPWISGGKDT